MICMLPSQNKSIDWIVVYVYRPMYTSPTVHPAREPLRDSYHPLFDMYGVDLVLQGHNHNYQRSYPLRYNATNFIHSYNYKYSR